PRLRIGSPYGAVCCLHLPNDDRTTPEGSTRFWPWRKPQAALHGVYLLSDVSALKGRLSWIS
ncbi:MAG: hypothetical protein KDD67_07765, partial [Ignavibacteriae bacterium]|nr:hypothetical protein [Ignavibacteriota bacterium]